MAETEEEIREMVTEANQLQKGTKYQEALEQLVGVIDKINLLPDGELSDEVMDSLLGLAWHYRGSTLQRMGQYEKAVEALNRAIEFREDDIIAKAYSVFQRFICKMYGKLPITDQEVEETKMALTAAMANNAVSIADIGNFLQNIAYIEQVKGSVEKAVAFYKMALVMREEAADGRGYALTQARLAECYKKLGKDREAREHGGSALEYFRKTRDAERIKQVEFALNFSVIFTGRCLIGSWLKFAQHG